MGIFTELVRMGWGFMRMGWRFMRMGPQANVADVILGPCHEHTMGIQSSPHCLSMLPAISVERGFTASSSRHFPV